MALCSPSDWREWTLTQHAAKCPALSGAAETLGGRRKRSPVLAGRESNNNLTLATRRHVGDDPGTGLHVLAVLARTSLCCVAPGMRKCPAERKPGCQAYRALSLRHHSGMGKSGTTPSAMLNLHSNTGAHAAHQLAAPGFASPKSHHALSDLSPDCLSHVYVVH